MPNSGVAIAGQTNNQPSLYSVGYARGTDAAQRMASVGRKGWLFRVETLELKTGEQSKFSLVALFHCYMDGTRVNKMEHLKQMKNNVYIVVVIGM